jgi:hypothetical protein
MYILAGFSQGLLHPVMHESMVTFRYWLLHTRKQHTKTPWYYLSIYIPLIYVNMFVYTHTHTHHTNTHTHSHHTSYRHHMSCSTCMCTNTHTHTCCQSEFLNPFTCTRAPSPPAAAAAAWPGRGRVPIVGWSLGGVGPDRGLRGGGRRGWREEWDRRLGPSYFFISLWLGPLNSLLWYVPSSRYIHGARLLLCSASTNKSIIIITFPEYKSN